MHSNHVFRRALLATCGACAVLLVSACDTQPAAPEAGKAPVPAASEAAAPVETLDYTALTEREDPARLLEFYVGALRDRNWSAAALAWDAGAGMTGERLQKAYTRDTAPEFAVGKGKEEAAAGSQFYEAPVVVTFGKEDDTIRGALTLRRAIDVPGAGEAQLAWRIERSTIGPEFEQ